MSGPPINPPEVRWYHVYDECPECEHVVDDNFGTAWGFLDLRCEQCGNTWELDTGGMKWIF